MVAIIFLHFCQLYISIYFYKFNSANPNKTYEDINDLFFLCVCTKEILKLRNNPLYIDFLIYWNPYKLSWLAKIPPLFLNRLKSLQFIIMKSLSFIWLATIPKIFLNKLKSLHFIIMKSLYFIMIGKIPTLFQNRLKSLYFIIMMSLYFIMIGQNPYTFS